MLLVEDLGTIAYGEAWKMQERLFANLVAAKKGGKPYDNRLLFCQHPPVYTLGRHGREANMLLTSAQLERIGATLFHTDRGGDITFHGPGQWVCYPILNLEDYHLGVKAYVYLLEEAVMAVCASYGVVCARKEGATGVWIGVGTPRERKICAMGIRCSHFVTMHGLALNVNTDLRYFSYIHPCGFVDKGVTSLELETRGALPMEEVRHRLEETLCSLLMRAACGEGGIHPRMKMD